MMRVLITGADGFIGSHLVEACLDAGYQVKAFVWYNAVNSWGWLDTLPHDRLEHIEVIAGDIRDPYSVEQAVKGVETIFHLAALIGIPFSYHAPDAYLDTNVKGTLHILQAARKHNVSRVIVTSTSEVYGTAESVPITEQHSLKAQSPYSATKIAADKMAESYYYSFGTPVAIARPFNTYGPRQSLRAVIPTIITQIVAGKREIRLGALHPTRDFNYVKDTCRGFLALARTDKVLGEVVNIASATEISIGALVQKIGSLMQADISIQTDDERMRPQKSEVERLVGDNRKLRALTDWQPEYDLDKGLMNTIEWWQASRPLINQKTLGYTL